MHVDRDIQDDLTKVISLTVECDYGGDLVSEVSGDIVLPKSDSWIA